MPTIIAIDTSCDLASVALLRGGKVDSLSSSGVQTHSQTVLPMLQQLLSQAGMTFKNCDAIAFGAGPGSFTGVRTACGVAQGLALGADLPVIPVVTLEAMAEACREVSQAMDVLAVLDARMHEVYWAQYRYDETGEWQTVAAPALSPSSSVKAAGPVVACGNGLSAYASSFSGSLFAKGSLPEIMPHAVHVAKLAERAFLRGQMVPARDAQPIYLRNKVALTVAERAAEAGKKAA